MSRSSSSALKIGEAVCCIVDDVERIGLVKRVNISIGFSTKYIGIELIEPIFDGHDGYFNDVRYFHAREGCGIIVDISNIIQKLSTHQLIAKVQQVIAGRDECIVKLKKKLKYLTSPQMSGSTQKHSEYTKWESKEQLTGMHGAHHDDDEEEESYVSDETSEDEQVNDHDLSFRDAMSPMTSFSTSNTCHKQQKIMSAFPYHHTYTPSPSFYPMTAILPSNQQQTKPIKIRSIYKPKPIIDYPGASMLDRKRSNSMIYFNNQNDEQFVGRKRSNSLDFSSPILSPIVLTQSPHQTIYGISPQSKSAKLYTNSPQVTHQSTNFNFTPKCPNSLSEKTMKRKSKIRKFNKPVPEIRKHSK